MTRQEFDEAYNNGYIHGYKAGRSDSEALEDVRLKKIRKDIEKECKPCIYEVDFAYKKGLSRTLEIIDKYKGVEE